MSNPDLGAGMAQPEIKAWNLIANMEQLYANWHPEKGENALFDEHAKRFLENPTWTGRGMYDALLAAEKAGDAHALNSLNLMLVACAYCMQAVRASRNGQESNAWPFVVEAGLIVGSLIATSAGSGPTDPAPTQSLSAMGVASRRAATAARIEKVRAWCEPLLATAPSLNWLRERVASEQVVDGAAKSTTDAWITKLAEGWRAAGLWTKS